MSPYEVPRAPDFMAPIRIAEPHSGSDRDVLFESAIGDIRFVPGLQNGMNCAREACASVSRRRQQPSYQTLPRTKRFISVLYDDYLPLSGSETV